jgi:hypothetical protein
MLAPEGTEVNYSGNLIQMGRSLYTAKLAVTSANRVVLPRDDPRQRCYSDDLAEISVLTRWRRKTPPTSSLCTLASVG